MARTSRSPRLRTEAGPGAPPAGAAGADRRARLRLGLSAGAVLLAAADTYVVVLALPAMMGDVGISIDQLQRATPIISGFLLGYVVVLPLLGRLSDVYGRRPVLLGCLALFAAGSVVTASAHALAVVVAGRTLQGLGGGGLVPVTLALVADLWPPGRRGVPLGVVGAVQELGSVLGPLYGAALVALSGWRLIFWVNVPIAAGVGLAFALLGDGGEPGTVAAPASSPSGGRRFDAVGAGLLGLAGLAGLLAILEPAALTGSDTLGQLYLPLAGHSGLTTSLALTAAAAAVLGLAWEWLAPPGRAGLVPLRRLPELGAAVDWPGALLLGGVLGGVIIAFATADPAAQVVAGNAVVSLPLAALCAAGFVVRELGCADPLVDLRALADRAAAGSLLVNLAAGAALMAALVDVPIFARATVDPDSQLGAALVLTRLLVAVPVGAVLGGLVCERLSYRGVAALGMLLCAGGFLLMARWSDGALAERGLLLGIRTPVNGTDLTLAACGLGFGLAIAPVNASILGAVGAAVHGLASALVVVARMVGMLGGLALLTAVGLRRFFESSARIPSPARLCPASPASCPVYDHLSTLAVVDEIHAIFSGAAVCAAVAAVLALATLRRSPSPAGAVPEGGLLARLATG